MKTGIGLGAPSEAYNCIKHLSDRRATACIPSGERQDLCATNQPPIRQPGCTEDGQRGAVTTARKTVKERARETPRVALDIINFHYREFAN